MTMNLMKRSVLILTALLLPLYLGSAVAADGKGDAAKGKKVFEENGCERCHNVDTTVAKRPPAPSLKGIFQRPPHQLADGTEHKQHTDAMLGEIVVNGTSRMPARGAVLTDEEVADLMAYLHSI